MTVEIGDLLNRRTDLATFLVHLTKEPDPKANLLAMLTSGLIEARTPMGWAARAAVRLGVDAANSQKAVCFSETPLEHCYTLFQEIAGRRERFKPYGLAFTKVVARRKAVNPVWYIDMSVGRTWVLRNALDAIQAEATVDEATFLAHPGSQVFPFCEPMGVWSAVSKREFWWEREWRHIGDLAFRTGELALILAPEEDHPDFERIVPGKTVDPAWSLERMIARFVGLSRWDVTNL